MLPATCRVKFDDPHSLHDFTLLVTPDEGFWLGGRFCFHVFITEEYNMAVSKTQSESYREVSSLARPPDNVQCNHL